MFEFSTTSIIIIAVCAIAIIALLFLYLYIGRKENQAGQISVQEPEDDQIAEQKQESAAAENAPAEEMPANAETEVFRPVQASADEIEISADISQEEDLAASLEEAFGSEPAPETEKTAEAVTIPGMVKNAESELVSETTIIAEPTLKPEPEKAAEAEPAPAAEKAAEAESTPAFAPELVPEQPVRPAEPDLSVLYQEVDEEDYEQVGTDVADAIALAFEQAIKPVSAAADSQPAQSTELGQSAQSAAQQTAQTSSRHMAGHHIRGRIGNEETAAQERQNASEMPVGAERTAAPGSVRRHRHTDR